MTKAVLISIQPQHAMNILNGDKTIELRKVVLNWVKEEVAKGNKVKFLMYVTKALPYVIYESGSYDDGDFAKDYAGYNLYTKQDVIDYYLDITKALNGKIVASFDVSKIEDVFDEDENGFVTPNMKIGTLCYKSMVDKYLIDKYKPKYALHIENLKEIKPMELSDVGINYSVQNMVTICYDDNKTVVDKILL